MHINPQYLGGKQHEQASSLYHCILCIFQANMWKINVSTQRVTHVKRITQVVSGSQTEVITSREESDQSIT